MTKKTGRNAPCPCGSGKKYKVCCIDKPNPAKADEKVTPQFQFEPGSYGDIGHFVPSIACLKQSTPDNWEHHFVLVKPVEQHYEAESAADSAAADLETAFRRKESTGTESAVAEYLKSEGYVKISDFRIVGDESETVQRSGTENQPADIIGYSAYDPVEECYEYNESECYVADSPKSLKNFLAVAIFPIENYRIDAVTFPDFARDYGLSYGSYALEPQALKRFERIAKESGFDYHVEEYEDLYKDTEPKLFIVKFKP